MTRRRNQAEMPDLPRNMREAWAELRNDYAAGTNSRFRPQPTGVSSMGSGADYHYRNESNYLRMIERSRFFDRNNLVVGQGVNRLVANVLQDGFTLDVKTPDDKLNEDLTARWNAEAGDAEASDLEGEKTFFDLERLLLRAAIVDGDVLCLPEAESGAIQHVEGHRLRTPSGTKRNVVLGILLDELGRRKEYWLTKQDLDPLASLSRVSDIRAYPARDAEGHRQVFHIYEPKRLSQRRGVTAFAPIVDAVGMHDDLQFAHLVKAQVAACFAILEEFDISVKRAGNTVLGNTSTETLGDGGVRQIEGLGPGMRISGHPGSKLVGFSPNIPNAEFFDHALLILTFIAINLDLPVAVLLLDPSNTNFSGWRGAMDQARIRFRQIQRTFRSQFHTPVYRWKVRRWISEDRPLQKMFETHGEAIFGHEWHLPTWPYIEPNKDASADDLRLSRCLTSRRRIQAERGRDEADVAKEIVADNGELIRLAKKEAEKLNKEFPDDDAKITWQHVLQPCGAAAMPITDPNMPEPPAAKAKPEPKVNGFATSRN